uniref:Protein kinase domain-containing protein n=1 Tax=Romanomermis culicivorax TaxID=13658 RepID=A0A915JGL1_ROMCU
MGGMKLNNTDEKACESKISVPEIDYKELKFYERLSSGSFGTVYRAEWSKTGKIVAVKRVLVLEKEAHVLNLIRHKNIIQFFGAVTEPPNFCIVLEFASKGSLFSLLHKEDNDSDSKLSFELLMKWAIDIATGVNYLHNEAPCKIIHRGEYDISNIIIFLKSHDIISVPLAILMYTSFPTYVRNVICFFLENLKSGNVVIDESNTCKLCDFGTSKPLLHTTKMTTVGTVAWMSPEMIQSSPVGEPTDTWSFGVVLWELLTRQVPFKGFESFRVAWMVVEENERLCIPSGCPQNLKVFLHKCWDKDPKARPLFPEILNIVNDAQTSADTVNFLKQKNRWIDEIEQHIFTLQSKEKELSERETKLLDWEKRLARREQNIENSRKLSMTQNGNSPKTICLALDEKHFPETGGHKFSVEV